MFTRAPDGIVVVDGAGLITRLNDRAATMFGYAPGELLGAPVEQLLPERRRARHVEQRAAYVARPDPRPMGAVTLVGRRKNGADLPVDISLDYEHDARGELRVIAFVRDATARRRLEAELRATEENVRLLLEGAGEDAILMLDPLGRVVSSSSGAPRGNDRDPIDAIGRHFSTFYVPEDIASGQPERDLELAATEGSTRTEGWRVRAGGQRFWAETTLSAVHDDHHMLRGFAAVTRDRTESHEARARLDTFAELNRAALEGRPDDDLLEFVVSRARAMVGAPLVAAWTPGPHRDEFVVAYAEGDLAASLVGTRLGPDPRVPPELAARGLTYGVFVPLRVAQETFAVLGVVTTADREPLLPHEIELLDAFGLQAAAAFALARSRRDTEQLQLMADRERIARDLHDSVIQRLFAVGLSLETASRLTAADSKARLQQAVADIDETIRSIRSSILILEGRAGDAPTLRGQVLAVASDAARTLGFEPSVRFAGPVDTLTSMAVTGSLVAAVREALANVARHARATESNVTVTAADDIVLVVDDDGCGAQSFARDGGHGVGNLRERARTLGGDCSITARAPRGTRVEWRVPAPR